MTPLRLAFIALCVGTIVAALAVWRRDPRHGPVAWYLCTALGLDLLRLWLRQLMPLEPAVREGFTSYLRHVDQAAYLGLIALLPAMAMVLFLRRRPWPVAGAWLAALVWTVAFYPSLRGADLLWFYTGLELAGALASVGLFITWLGRGTRTTTPIMCGLVLISASLTSVLLPPLVGEGTLARWPVIVALHAVSLAVVLVLQLRALTASAATRPRS